MTDTPQLPPRAHELIVQDRKRNRHVRVWTYCLMGGLFLTLFFMHGTVPPDGIYDTPRERRLTEIFRTVTYVGMGLMTISFIGWVRAIWKRDRTPPAGDSPQDTTEEAS